MPALLRCSITPVWLLLVVGTVLSWWLGVEGTSASTVMFIASAKCFVVGMFFMELIHAPRWLQHLWQAWCALATVAVSVLY